MPGFGLEEALQVLHPLNGEFLKACFFLGGKVPDMMGFRDAVLKLKTEGEIAKAIALAMLVLPDSQFQAFSIHLNSLASSPGQRQDLFIAAVGSSLLAWSIWKTPERGHRDFNVELWLRKASFAKREAPFMGNVGSSAAEGEFSKLLRAWARENAAFATAILRSHADALGTAGTSFLPMESVLTPFSALIAKALAYEVLAQKDLGGLVSAALHLPEVRA